MKRAACATGERTRRPVPRAADFGGCAWMTGHVGAESDNRIENRDQTFEVAGTQRGKERVDDLALARELARSERRDATAAAARSRAVSPRWAYARRSSDLLERQVEHVVQHEGEVLGGFDPKKLGTDSKARQVCSQR